MTSGDGDTYTPTIALFYFGRLHHGSPEDIAPGGDSQGYNEQMSVSTVELRMARWLMVDMTTHISQ